MSNYQLVNTRLLSVQITQEQVYSKCGTMVAYQGSIQFTRSFLAGGTIQSAAMRSATGEGFDLMAAQGTGMVYYAYYGQHITLIPLQGETVYIESDRILAFSDHLRVGTVFIGAQGSIQGAMRGAMTGQGLFTTTLQGMGEIAIISDGSAIALEVTPAKPIFVDPNAYLGHSGQLDSSLVTDIGWKNLIGKSSGESYQLKFTGMGKVYIQPSEQ